MFSETLSLAIDITRPYNLLLSEKKFPNSTLLTKKVCHRPALLFITLYQALALKPPAHSVVFTQWK